MIVNALTILVLILVAGIFVCLWFLGTFKNETHAAQYETHTLKKTLQAVKQQHERVQQELDTAQTQLKELKAKPPPPPASEPAPQLPTGEQLPTRLYLLHGCRLFSPPDDMPAYLPVVTLYQHYLSYCQQNSLQPINKSQFGQELKALGLRCDRQYVDKRQCRIVWGVTPKN